jgi:protein SCO1/2
MNRVIVWGLAFAALIAFGLSLAGRQGMLGEPPGQQMAQVSLGGPFTLVRGDGVTVTEADFAGGYTLVLFGYTFCPDVCPTALATASGALAALGEDAEKLTVLFVTVDPERDTPAVVGDYVANFHSRVVGLSGSAEQIAAMAGAYHVYYAKAEGGATEDYLVDHSAALYLMGPNGEYLANFRFNASAEELAAGLREHLT